MYKNIVFDVDGTLIDTESADLQALHDMMLDLTQKDIPLEDLRFAIGIPGVGALTDLGLKNTENAFALWRKYYLKHIGETKVFPGISEVLEQLAGRSCVLGIVTSRLKFEFLEDVDPLGLSHYFPFIVCADDTEEHKPHPAPMHKFLELSGADPSSTLYVGDTVYDMECARAAGVASALALWGGKPPKNISATYFLREPGELLNL